MIYVITYYACPEERNLAKFGEPPKVVNPYEVFRRTLELTEDVFIFLVTRDQALNLAVYLKKYDLEKFLIVDHRGGSLIERGITNPNYPTDHRKLKLFILKGKGAN